MKTLSLSCFLVSLLAAVGCFLAAIWVPSEQFGATGMLALFTGIAAGVWTGITHEPKHS